MAMVERSGAADGSAAARATMFVAVEMSRPRGVVACHTPLVDKVGCHAVARGDVPALRALIERRRARAERALGVAPAVLCG